MIHVRWCNVLDAMVNMQITNAVLYDTSKGSLFKQIKSHLVVEHAFLLTGVVC